MALSSELVSQFVKATNDSTKKKTEATVTGVVVEYGDRLYVKLDGSDRITPCDTTVNAKVGERVTVLVKDHTATVTGNVSSPSASTGDVKEVDDKVTEVDKKVTEFYSVVADKASIEDLNATNAEIKNLKTDKASIKDLEAANAEIENLKVDKASVKDLEAANAKIDNLKTKKLDADAADLKFATIANLDATNANVDNLKAEYGDFKQLTADNFTANAAEIDDLKTKKLDAEQASLTYATIDFANINQAAAKKIFSDSGIIKDLVVSEGHITGELVGVTIKGDLIEGGTVVADKLVVKGKNGLYYKLNTDGVTIEAEQTDYNSLNGSIITAKSITATKISVNDLVAFDATIGGFNITEDSLYSGVKSSVGNTTRGVYLDNQGQISFGDDKNFITYYKSTDGTWKLAISANTIKFGSGLTLNDVADKVDKTADKVDKTADDVQKVVDSYEKGELNGKDAAVLRIDSSRGNVFKNNAVATALTVRIFYGDKIIETKAQLDEAFGSGAYLEWSWQRLDEDRFGVISSSDSRISQNGFCLTISPDDVDVKTTFACELKV